MIIKEFLPNPAGNDKDGEYIKLFNDSNNPVLLGGWSIKNISGKIYKLSGELGAKEELILPYLKTKIPLSNNGETVFLYDEKGLLADKLGYAGGTGLKVGEIINRNQKLATNNQQLESRPNSQITNYPMPAGRQELQISNFLFINFLIAAILAGLALYIILELEKKLDIKLW